MWCQLKYCDAAAVWVIVKSHPFLSLPFIFFPGGAERMRSLPPFGVIKEDRRLSATRDFSFYLTFGVRYITMCLLCTLSTLNLWG